MKITDIVQRSDTTPGRIFDGVVVGLIVVSVITLSMDTLPNLSPFARTVFDASEVIIVGLFTLEYCLRVATAAKRFRYIFSFYGIIDLAAVIPFYLSLGALDLRALRIARLFPFLQRCLVWNRHSGLVIESSQWSSTAWPP